MLDWVGICNGTSQSDWVLVGSLPIYDWRQQSALCHFTKEMRFAASCGKAAKAKHDYLSTRSMSVVWSVLENNFINIHSRNNCGLEYICSKYTGQEPLGLGCRGECAPSCTSFSPVA